MTQKEIESRSLVVSTVFNGIFTAAGIWVFAATRIQALFLDCFFSFIALLSTIMATLISKTSKKTTIAYPEGLYFLEPLYAILKSALVLSLLVFSVIATAIPAYQYFAYGIGNEMNIAPVLPYTIIMVFLCFSLGFYNMWQNKKINNISTMLAAESKSNIVDGLQSAGIGLAVILLSFVDKTSSLGFLHYTGDFFITFILVLISLKMPLKILVSAFKELTGGISDDEIIKQHINAIIDAHLNIIVPEKRCDIFKVGMHINIRVLLPNSIGHNIIDELKTSREKIIHDLQLYYDSIKLNFVF
ncbi:MAG: cation transporter [Spirochaetaceae bacterium]|jgi:predicted Co/Zn/Cd cation transporter (cation efflux family)|nr:cation transporter [Spirochaetaceae bacterium]